MVPSWKRACDLTCAALLAGEMCVVATGLPGTGKSLLVQAVASTLRFTGWKVATFVAGLPTQAEFAALTDSAAILIDDADQLSENQFRMLNRWRRCSVLLIGAVGLEKRCAADSRVTLAPLELNEVVHYVELWLARTKHQPDLLSRAAIVRVADASAGVPRLLGALLPASIAIASAAGAGQVEEIHVDKAAWRQVEGTAARRLGRRIPHAAAEAERDDPAENAGLNERLSQAPLAHDFSDAPASLISNSLKFAGLGVLLGVVAAAGLLSLRHWSEWASFASSSVFGTRSSPIAAPAVDLALTRADDPAQSAKLTIARPELGPAPISPAPLSPPSSAPTAPAMVSGPTMREVPAVVDEVAPAVAGQADPMTANAAVQTPNAPAAAPVVAPEAGPEPRLAADPAPEGVAPATVRLLYQRGQEMMALNDYSAARLLFSRAAESGSVQAMVGLGRSYDPVIVGSLGNTAGADPVLAAKWYHQAAALGSSDARILLLQLERARDP